jgi:bacillaene synthase trans-acting acyltransferase
MLAVLGPQSLFEDRKDIFGATTLACLNYAENFVVTGTREQVAVAQAKLGTTDIPCLILPITRGFHSPLLNPLEDELKRTVAGFELKSPAWPIVSSLRARTMTAQDLNPLHCWDLLRFPVRFSETVRYLEAQGSSTYIDVGPSGTLASFVRMVVGRDGSSKAFPIVTQFGRDVRNLEKLRADLAA